MVAWPVLGDAGTTVMCILRDELSGGVSGVLWLS